MIIVPGPAVYHAMSLVQNVKEMQPLALHVQLHSQRKGLHVLVPLIISLMESIAKYAMEPVQPAQEHLPTAQLALRLSRFRAAAAFVQVTITLMGQNVQFVMLHAQLAQDHHRIVHHVLPHSH